MNAEQHKNLEVIFKAGFDPRTGKQLERIFDHNKKAKEFVNLNIRDKNKSNSLFKLAAKHFIEQLVDQKVEYGKTKQQMIELSTKH